MVPALRRLFVRVGITWVNDDQRALRDPTARGGERELDMTAKRNRQKNPAAFDERLQRVADEAREAAGKLPQGEERDALLRKARQAETAAHLNAWLSSPGLQCPR